VTSFFGYLIHRNLHRFNFLWRGFHQIHHAPQRVDIAGAALFHPTDVLVQVSVASVVSGALGLSPVAGSSVGYIAAFYAFFQHLNIRTPQWLGYLIQRPESHCIHHQENVHAFNYSDFPLWDILAGTFKNPKEFSGNVGFGPEASRRYLDMLLFRDV